MLTRCCVALVLFALTNLVSAQQDNKPSYQTLLDRAKQGDPKLDFKALRLAYTETATYNPYDPARDLQAAILKSLGEKQYERCLEHIEKGLQKNYVNINFHFAAYRCHTELKNLDKARFHKYMLDGLIKSILASGDGKSPDSAYIVISTDEEYALLDAVGLRRASQALIKENGHSYDRIVARDDRGEKDFAVYFNIDLQFHWLRKTLEKGSK